MRDAAEEKAKHAPIWWKNLMERDHIKRIYCSIIIQLTVKKQGGMVESGYLCPE
jgi:hypothetical protein